MFLLIRVTNLVQGERKSKSQRAKIKNKLVFYYLLERGRDSTRLNLFANFRTAALIRLIFKCSFQSPQFLGGHRHDGAVAGEEVFSE